MLGWGWVVKVNARGRPSMLTTVRARAAQLELELGNVASRSPAWLHSQAPVWSHSKLPARNTAFSAMGCSWGRLHCFSRFLMLLRHRDAAGRRVAERGQAAGLADTTIPWRF